MQHLLHHVACCCIAKHEWMAKRCNIECAAILIPSGRKMLHHLTGASLYEDLYGFTFAFSKRRLSASSSSSSDGSSSDSSSDSESSDSENDSKEPGDIENRRAVKRPSNPNVANGDEMTVNSPQSPTQNMRYGQLNSRGRITPKGKSLKEDELDKQVSPLNSIPKDLRKESEISPMGIELSGFSSLNHNNTKFLVTDADMPKNLSSTISPDKVDNLANCSRTDSAINVDHMLTNGNYEPFPYNFDDGLIFEKPEDLISESIAAMISSSPDRFEPMDLPIVDHNDISAPSTVDLVPIISPGLDTDKSSHKEKVKGGKGTGITSKSIVDTEDSEEFSTSGGRRVSSISTPVQSKMQSKKDKEQDWIKNILSTNKKNFDLPYINVEELISPVKAANTAPLKVQIPLSKIHHPGKKPPRLENGASNSELQKRQKVKGKDITLYGSKKSKSKVNDKSKSKGKGNSSKVKNEKPRHSVGKDIEQIKSLMKELSSKASEDEEADNFISTPSPLKAAPKPEARVSGKSIRGTPVSYIAKKDPTPRGASCSDSSDLAVGLESTKDVCKKKSESQKGNSRKRNSSSLSHGDTEDKPARHRTSKKHKASKETNVDHSGSIHVVEHSDDSNTGFKTPNSVVSNHIIGSNKLFVSIKLSQLKRFPGNCEEEEESLDQRHCIKENDCKNDAIAELNPVARPVSHLFIKCNSIK